MCNHPPSLVDKGLKDITLLYSAARFWSTLVSKGQGGHTDFYVSLNAVFQLCPVCVAFSSKRTNIGDFVFLYPHSISLVFTMLNTIYFTSILTFPAELLLVMPWNIHSLGHLGDLLGFDNILKHVGCWIYYVRVIFCHKEIICRCNLY